MCECGLSQCPRPISVGKPKEQDMNDWHKKGGLPPVGEIVELLWGGVSQCTVEIISYRNNKNTVVFWRMDNDHADSAETPTVTFRPLPTETEFDKARADILDIIEANGNLSNGILADTLTEQGYRKIKPMTEDEFVTEIQSELSEFRANWAGHLYRAGCRFIDQGQ